ncbi:yjeF C-terminal region, hydroxyethylthiazole kinase-related/yjeF N-terminal region [Yoonia tamlensis]|uniref:Bifunctional NAD(P)H-hydrate repair enzyme n=1 Tax=Yoonia tamlensis TaxID=390270 RepID=A0A1I6GHZ3_9RHOB|nr:NAD(P)H-hydrate dehydratase [Yoonia tamlensis]SFR41794.1 yjeF C-terminal region, hydroxyethylthiazole kinase-related/yjeF N-terminal region [Yoonia tamlensis]
MTEVLTAAQMRAIETAAIASGDVTGLELMERAGRGVVSAIFEEWPELAPSWGPAPKPPEYFLQDDEKGKHRAVVLCGPGNNGGDGFVVARLLFAAGWDVEVFLYGDADKLPPDAKANYARWLELGRVCAMSACTSERWVGQPLVIDAVFGIGACRPLPDTVRNVLMATVNCPRIAIDVPSMLSSDTGMMLSPMWGGVGAARLTVTFHTRKPGHLLEAGPENCGKLRVVDIGLGRFAVAHQAHVRLAQCHTIGALGKGNGHKYSHGHAFILSGGIAKGGAARLAARGALRIGAGAVTVGCPEAALVENATQLNAVMLTSVDDAAAFEGILEDARINALCIGPGLGLGAREAALVGTVLESGRAAVLDADALTLLARDAGLFAKLHKSCVLTPHAGEFARLFPDIADRLNAPATKGPAYSKVDAAREAAKRAGCVVLFKGPDTVISDPKGRCSINASVYARAAPWLATAGSGDVLAGFITGLLARGFAPQQAAESGAWLHTECALKFGPGLIAEDLPEQLPAVLRALEAS